MKSLIVALALFFVAVGVASFTLGTNTATAAPVDVFEKSCKEAGSSGSTLCKDRDEKLFGPDSFWNRVLNTMIFVGGAVAVLMIVLGGLRYVTSNGDSSQITTARQTIMYAVIGLVVMILAFSIVNFVITRI